MTNIIKEIEQEQMTRDIPKFEPGDTVVVNVRVKEGNRERFHRAQDLSWHRCGACFPDLQPADRFHCGQA